MIAFIKADSVSDNKYVTHVYTCENFAKDTKHNAVQAGYRCGLVEIDYYNGTTTTTNGITYVNGHTIICFNTTDQGLIFIEPQFDDIVKVTVGQSYSALNNYTPQTDDIIKVYNINWLP